jgi:hypothetical protein
VAQVLDHLPAKHEAPSSNPNTAKKKKRSIKSKNGNTLNVGKGARKKKETGDQADDKELVVSPPNSSQLFHDVTGGISRMLSNVVFFSIPGAHQLFLSCLS